MTMRIIVFVIILMFTLFSHYLKIVSGSGKLSIQFLNFINPDGKTSTGKCCDGKPRFGQCVSGCDYVFNICLGQGLTFSSCEYGLMNSGEVSNDNKIMFGKSVGLLDNPIIVHLDSWPSKFAFNIRVWDADHENSADHVADLQKKAHVFPTNTQQTIRMSNRVYLNLIVSGDCDPGFYGPQCDVYCKANTSSTFSCGVYGKKICKPGWTGNDCSDNIDDCISSPCLHDGKCIDGINNFTCQCPSGYTGGTCHLDLNECVTYPGLCNHGDCINKNGSFVCLCQAGYAGPRCLSELNACEEDPCQNDGVCSVAHTPAGFVCLCSDGYTGKLCDEDVNECQSTLCQNNGTCVNVIGSFQCRCITGFHGNICENDVDECAASSNPCGLFGKCQNHVGGFECICSDGYTGNTSCENINECVIPDTSPCKNNATCVDTQGSFSCQCSPHWSGPTCEVNVDECATGPCFNQGICVDADQGFYCACYTGWKGTFCQEDINECDDIDNPCLNGGKCHNTAGSFRCECVQGWIGSLCERKPQCHRICKNNGTCVPSKDGFLRCVCSPGWTGEHCEMDVEHISLIPPSQLIDNAASLYGLSDCFYEGRGYVDGEEWTFRENNNCLQCSCREEKIKCRFVDCKKYEDDFHLTCDFKRNVDGFEFDKRLKTAVSHVEKYSHVEVQVKHTTVKEKNKFVKNRQDSVLVFPRVTVNGVDLNNQEISDLFHNHVVKDSLRMLCPQYPEQIMLSHAHQLKSKIEVPKLKEPWYPFVVLVAGICSIVACGVMFLRYRARHETKDLETNSNSHTCFTNGKSHFETLADTPQSACINLGISNPTFEEDSEQTSASQIKNQTNGKTGNKLNGVPERNNIENSICIEAEVHQNTK